MAAMRGDKGLVAEIFLTGRNVTPSDYISIDTILMSHADMSSTHPFVLRGKIHLFLLVIVVFHTVALLRRRMCYKCVDHEMESFILWYVFLRVLACVCVCVFVCLNTVFLFAVY